MQADAGPSRGKKSCRPGWIYDETNPVLSDFRQKMSERFPTVLEGTWAPYRNVYKVLADRGHSFMLMKGSMIAFVMLLAFSGHLTWALVG